MIDDVRILIPGVTYKPVSGAGHGILFQKPGLIRNAIVSFLRAEDDRQPLAGYKE